MNALVLVFGLSAIPIVGGKTKSNDRRAAVRGRAGAPLIRHVFFAAVCALFSTSAFAAEAASVAGGSTKEIAKEGSKEVTGLCASSNRRKVELHPEQSKSDGTFVLLCGDEALLIKNAKILHRLPIHITWIGNADKTPIHPAVKHMDFGSRDIVTVQIDSAGDSERSKLCSQIISVYRSELVSGPGFCRAGDSDVKQISSRERGEKRELLVTTIESPGASPVPADGHAAPAPTRAKLIVNEIWHWHRSEWRMRPNDESVEKAKYGKDAVLLANDHQYMREASAPDYWALAPFYAAQKSDSACSIASISMVVNAILNKKDRAADEELATQSDLIKEMKNDSWRAAVIQGGAGITLDQLKLMLEASLKVSGISDFTIETVHTDSASAEVRNRLHRHLVNNEASDRNFIIANFSQGVFTGDVPVGHMAPVGAYDEKRKRVLILDPDRQWYQPYWVAEEVFLKGMTTQDKVSGHARGYVWLQLK